MNILLRKSGIVMAEALMAVTILATGSVAVGMVSNNAMSSMQASRDYLIAQGLVGSTLEVAKSILETNAMRYPDDRTCWLTLGPNIGTSDCSGVEQAAENKYYLVGRAGSGEWILVDSGNNVGPDANGDASVQDKYRMYLDNVMYEQSQNPGSLSNPTKYYRSLTFLAIDDTNPAKAGDESTLVEATILWKEGRKVRTITRRMTLGNFL